MKSADEVQLPRSFWVELLRLYDEFIELGKTDQETLEMLEKAGLLREGTVLAKEIMENYPHLKFSEVDAFVKQGIREKIVEKLRKAPVDV